MFFCLIVALFAVLVFSTPIPCDSTPTPSYTPTPSPSTTSISTTTTTPTPSSTPATSVTPASDASTGPFTDGIATYFYQNGNAGACGAVHSDYDFICAMDQARFGTSYPSPLCGQKVQITNSLNGQTITVTIADDCPTCKNSDSIDLSVGAFEALTGNNLSIGEFPISWILL